MNELDSYQKQQLTGQAECYIHTHPERINYTFPHGAFSDTTDQTAAINTATAMKFNTTDVNDGVDVVSTTQLTVPKDGVYNIQFSAQFVNIDTPAVEVSIWFYSNGSNIPNSNTMLTVPGKHAGGDGHAVAAWNLFTRLSAGDYVEIRWSTASTNVYIEHTATQVTPTRPATPSVIATVSFVSE